MGNLFILDRMKKHPYYLLLLLLVFSCTQEKSKESRVQSPPPPAPEEILHQFLIINEKILMGSVKHYVYTRSIDPYHMFRFQINERDFLELVKNNGLVEEKHSIPHKKRPEWFDPPTDRQTRSFWKEKPGYFTEILVYDRRYRTAYFYHASM